MADVLIGLYRNRTMNPVEINLSKGGFEGE
jgi:hypothetical protein